jgi:hypothetical protein
MDTNGDWHATGNFNWIAVQPQISPLVPGSLGPQSVPGRPSLVEFESLK